MITAEESPFTLAACAEMVFTDLPLLERVERIAERGLEVEIWDWAGPGKNLKDMAATGAVFGSMTGYVTGDLTEADGIEELLSSARRSIEAAAVIGCPRLNLHGTGLDGRGLPVRPVTEVTGAMWARAALTCERIAALGRQSGVVFTLENLNLPTDHPGTPFSHPGDTRALVAAVDSPHLRMNLDLYHAQIGDGRLIDTCRESLPWIGEIQIADVPGRCQPGTGEIDYANVASALAGMGYEGVVAMEAWAEGDPADALDTFISTFTPRS
ncbi:TIM barrel protein [uncultured Propionibacterium sp.]|uniref:TIM barrel protein n=1 Tax=uncultured Propionibacterium sp. TaxID=218066 RepID=UPI002931E283|nr:TIM barrel protein [uncultured Propionibacterium sp.]